MTNLSINQQQPSHSRSDRDLTKVTKVRVRTTNKEAESANNKQKTKMKTTTMIINDSSSDNRNHSQGPIDVVRSPLNWQLAESTANALQMASDDLVQLYKRISLDHDLEERTRSEFLDKLSSSAGMARQTLQLVTRTSNGGTNFNNNTVSY